MPQTRSTFWGPQVWDERPQAPGLVSWAEPEQRPEASAYREPPGSGGAAKEADLEWGLQPQVTLEQISAFWSVSRSSVGFLNSKGLPGGLAFQRPWGRPNLRGILRSEAPKNSS